MRILIEEYQYDVSRLKNVLHGIDALENVEGRVSIHYVGYFYNTVLKDCVFILPKVLLKDTAEGERVFGKYSPEDIVDPAKNKGMDSKDKDFLYKFAVWIYRAITVYKNDRNNDTSIVYHTKIAQVGKGRRRLSNTYLDILLQLLQFNRDNQNFFFFILKNLHSGYNKINWTRTIARTSAIVQDNSPIYLRPVNKKRKINFDEELLVIFFSILNYIGDKYGFDKDINCQFDLITGKRFETYLKGYGKTRLLQIKYKYFSDKALELWNLCFSFFDEARQVFINTAKKEYLLVKNFYIVFEAIIDELIGDNPLPDGMDKKQEDGKIVDHLYTAKSLIENDHSNTYYIGDSKYYKMGHQLGNESVYKQYTYARNVIQWNLDIFSDGKVPESDVRLRDNVTEGYNIIPNFFISAKMDETFDYGNDGIEKTDRSHNKHRKTHFENRLFDRDTLLLFHYDVNFLFVLSLYARDNASQKAKWKTKVREKFRDEIRGWLQDDYDFYALKSVGNPLAGEEFINEHFKDLQGKLFRPYADRDIYTLALEKPKIGTTTDDNAYRLLSEFFIIEPITLGENPKEHLDTKVVDYQAAHPYEPVPEDWLPEYHVERYQANHFVLGMYHDQEHWDWITGKNDKGTLIYNVRLGKSRDGAMPESRIRGMKPKFAILYEGGHEAENKYHVFRIHDMAKMTEKRMRQAMYPTNHGGPHGDYLIFRFDEEVSIGNFDINALITRYSIDHPEYIYGSPIYPTGEDLKKYKL
jgi:hypothetical protein